ncbi:hypothetical protein M0804_009756 [Polistes exclamans]|nr:hypothetical protein M0804_009756 [Polistes exclamans]
MDAYEQRRKQRKRPPSSSLSYPGAGGNDDARSPGSGGTPGPLSQQAPTSLDSSDPASRRWANSASKGRVRSPRDASNPPEKHREEQHKPITDSSCAIS